MNKKRCKNCGCQFIPQKHIVNQRYCTKIACQNARKRKWLKLRLKHNRRYRVHYKEIMRKWRDDNPNYWTRYKNKLIDLRVGRERALKRKIGQTGFKNTALKIWLGRSVLAKLRKSKKRAFSCTCRLNFAL